MFIHFYLYILNLISCIKTVNIEIRAVFSEEDDSDLHLDGSVSISSATPFIGNRAQHNNDDYVTSKDNNHVSKKICTFAKTVQVVNKYKDIVPLKVFNNANIQCAICLSTANQIQRALAEYKIGLSDPTEEKVKLDGGVRSFCEKQFNAFNHICNKYIDNINVVQFYNVLLERNSSISSFLCRRDGVFRDCMNIQLK